MTPLEVRTAGGPGLQIDLPPRQPHRIAVSYDRLLDVPVRLVIVELRPFPAVSGQIAAIVGGRESVVLRIHPVHTG